ncbi:hypothetical protein CR513_03851, partial [Mucuna pruriens]
MLEIEKPKSVRDDRLGFQRTLVELILNVQATESEQPPSTMEIIISLCQAHFGSVSAESNSASAKRNSHEDDLVVNSLAAVKYKIERMFVDQGSSMNVLYLNTFLEMGLLEIMLEKCPGTLVGLSSEQIEIRATFRAGSNAKIVLECNGVQNSENAHNIESKIQTQGLDSMIPSSTTIAMDDDDDSPLLARMLRFKSARVRWCSNLSPLVTFNFSVPSLHFLNREKRH